MYDLNPKNWVQINGGEPPFFLCSFFIIDYRGISRKARKFFRQIMLFINLILFLFFFAA